MSIYKYDSTQDELIPIASGGKDILYADAPIGSIIPFGGTTAPNGFLLCQGQAVSRTTYAELFAVIGTSFGSGDGSTTFNVPDLKGKTLVGLDSSDTNFNELGKIGGSKTHRHDFQFALYDYLYQPSGANAGMSGESDNAGAYRYSTGKYQGGIQTSTESVIVSTHTGYSSETANKITTTGDTDLGSSLQPYNTVNYIIKATQVDVPADIQSAIEEQNSYSTEETYTGKRWIDGKKIYRKVFEHIPFADEIYIVQETGKFASHRTTIIPSGVVDRIIDSSWVAIKIADNSTHFLLPRKWTSGDDVVITIDANCVKEDGVVAVDAHTNRTTINSATYEVTGFVEYTKV